MTTKGGPELVSFLHVLRPLPLLPSPCHWTTDLEPDSLPHLCPWGQLLPNISVGFPELLKVRPIQS